MSSKLHFDAVFQKYSIVLSKFEAASQYCQVNDREKYMHDIKTGLDEIEMCDHVNISTQERNKISIGYYYRVIRVLRDMDSKCDGCGERNRFFCLYWNENKEEPNDNQMKCDRQLWFEHACYLIQTSLRWNHILTKDWKLMQRIHSDCVYFHYVGFQLLNMNRNIIFYIDGT
eukprot:947920_1